MKKLVFLGIWFALCSALTAQNTVRFSLPDYPPYTFLQDGKPAGTGVVIMEKILKRMGIKYSLEIGGPYARVFLNLSQGTADGVFLASKNAERDAVGVFASTVTFSRWSWFTLADSKLDPKSPTFKAEAKVGTLMNTNQEKYVKDQGYAIAGNPGVVDLLYRMLKAGRVNVIFLSEDVFLDSLGRLGEKPENFRKFVERESPFSVYMGNKFLQSNPGFMEKLNAAIVAEVGKGL